MESNKDKINQIPIIDVLSKLGYDEKTHYKVHGNNIRMLDKEGKVSDGWIGSLSENRLFCKSGIKDGRFEGDVIGIIKGALNIDAGQAIKWAENAFNLEKVSSMPKSNKTSLSSKFNSLPALNEEQIKWLSGRGIEHNGYLRSVAKNNRGVISSAIMSEGGDIKAIQGRKIGDTDKKFRYQIEKEGDDGTGIFRYLPKPDKKIIFVVEGMTDFYTLVQFGVNVIGLVSATAGIKYLKSFHQKYQLIYIPDNDEAGEKSVLALEEAGIHFGKFNLTNFDSGLNDVNDAWILMSGLGITGEVFLKEIYDGCEKPPTNLDVALKKAIQNRSAGSWKIGDKVFDEATGGIIPGSLMVINGFTGEGKTTTMDWIIKKLTEVHNKKVAYCSMDDDVGKMLAMFLGRKFNKSWQDEIYPNIEDYARQYGVEKFENFLLYDDIREIEGFTVLVKAEKIDVLIIDYIQIIQGLKGSNKKEQMIYASEQLQILAKQNHCAVICLSQASMGEVQKPVLQRNPNESFMIRATADTFINVGVYQGKHKIGFAKNKYGSTKYKFTEHDTNWDERTGDISIFESFETMDNGKM